MFPDILKVFLFLCGLPHFLQAFEKFERRFDGFDGARGAFGFLARAVADDAFEVLARRGHPGAEFIETARVAAAEQLADRRVIEQFRELVEVASGGG